jgi:transposase
MLGKLCALCLQKYVQATFLRGLGNGVVECNRPLVNRAVGALKQDVPLALFGSVAHNYKDTHGQEFTATRPPSASLERTGRQPSSSGDGYRSSLSRQRVLRSERFGADQVRDAAQRPEGGPCCGGGAQAFGLSRPVFYVTQAVFQREGLPGLLPRKRGPKRPHKLNDEAMTVLLEAIQAAGRMPKSEELATLLAQRCGVEVHPRSILRRLPPFLRQEEKKRP